MSARKRTPRKRVNPRRRPSGSAAAAAPFHILAKPAGPSCNLACEYCFYTEKESLFGAAPGSVMDDEVLEAFIRQYVAANPAPAVAFAWQGGEPALAGLDFFRKAVALQEKYASGKTVTNSFQTNGTLLDDRWCEFLAAHGFLVGLSLDGPAGIHNRYRKTRAGKGSFDDVMRGLALLEKHEVEFNVLAAVTTASAPHPGEVYRFLTGEGVRFIQFIPVVEREASAAEKEEGLSLAAPPAGECRERAVAPWTPEPESFGAFLTGVFDEWVASDVGRVHVMNFEWALTAWMGGAAASCQSASRCGRALAVERDGGVYACDHYVYPGYLLGNIVDGKLSEMVDSRRQRAFGAAKETALARKCAACEFLFACGGDCPKHRFVPAASGGAPSSYLCEGYLAFFRHADRYFRAVERLIRAGRPAADVMGMVERLRGLE